ncbi:PTS system mannitol-specific IIA component/PTS system ascorbate-specific IIA component [Evansella vedderi]|uniref:PTS system mannitol-specific IIA component/PTS system ascorbate-specific IIA component n=1 Tax=Evansella vedderi TaxID=38282 RepID=A0ABT9ZNH7_9BACI|nr:PTS sugar transporter subunit IIA [Evansella vedderi]MDQ0252786.1 PTS system mannitol-specific IIA component/PTS system ascorbate-specific IIA component [Evansella vedderi]
MKFLEESLVALDIEVSQPEEAIREAGKLLLNLELIEQQYIEAMVASFQKNGPYFVLAPKIALPHARPEDGVAEAAVSLIRLNEPVRFGHASNDPVQLVFALAASSSEEHLQVLQKLMQLLGDENNVSKLLSAKSYQEINQLIGGNG